MIGQQWLYILALAFVGAAMGTVFDVYNTVSGAAKFFRFLRPVLDITFWVVSGFAVYYVALQMDSGRLRIYSFLLVLAGYILYRLFFHATVVASAFRIVRFTQSVFRGILRILHLLIWQPATLLFRLFAAIAKSIYRALCKVESGLFVVLRFLWFRIIWTWLTKIPGIERSFHYLDKLWKEFLERTSKWMRARFIRT